MNILYIPGNLLLMGEYAVIENGGKGITLAVDQYITLTLGSGEKLTIEGRFGENFVTWSPGEEESGIFPLLYKHCRKAAQQYKIPLFNGRIFIDSTNFYKKTKKQGLGSSAAVTVGICMALLPGMMKETLFPLAVKAHREFQNGRGSGYDIATSLFGGVGLFTGGTDPLFRPLDAPLLPEFYLFHNQTPVRTVASVNLYREWKARNPDKAREFLEASNRNVTQFLEARTSLEVKKVILQARDLGVWLGKEIGSPGDFDHMEEKLVSASFYKALGAGNEVGVARLLKGHAPSKDWEPLKIAWKGAVWK